MTAPATRTIAAASLALALQVEIACAPRHSAPSLPAALTADEFWRLSTEFSEPAGQFTHSENLVSNEELFAHTVHLLRPRGGAFIGVGPEQNFSYIARLEPAMAFIVDIRAENRHLHLLYKALFEMSSTRAEFVARLFSREIVSSRSVRASADDLFAAVAAASASNLLRDSTAHLVRQQLIGLHRLPLSTSDLGSIDRILGAFYLDGPQIHYGRSLAASPAGPSYRTLMTAKDARGVGRSYLASEKEFAFVKALQARNLIVPVIGDFSGSHALKAIGQYVRRAGSKISGFYGSNVQVYLNKQQMATFCGNLATLPSDARSSFIGSNGLQLLSVRSASCVPTNTPR